MTIARSPRIVSVGTEARWIAAGLGKSVEIEPKLAVNRVFVSNAVQPSVALLKTLALAVHATVLPVAGGYRLERTPADSAELHRSETEERIVWIQSRLTEVDAFRNERLAIGPPQQALSHELASEQAAFQSYAKHIGPFPKTFYVSQLLPSEELLESLVRRIGPEALAQVAPGEERVYEDVPVDEAKPLPAHDDLLDEYVARMAPYPGVDIPSQKSSPAFVDVGRTVRRPTRLRLRVTGDYLWVGFRLDGYDEKGGLVLSNSLFTLPNNPMRAAPTIVREALARPDAKFWPLSDASKAAMDEERQIVLGKTEALPAWLMDPDKNEPLNLFAAEALAAVAAQTPSKVLVVDVPDEVWAFAQQCTYKGRLCESAFEELLSSVQEFERLEDATSIVWRPKVPELVEASSADRNVLARFANTMFKDAGDPLRAIAELYHDACTNGSPLTATWSQVAVSRLGIQQVMPPAQVFRLLGGLSPLDWDALDEGRAVSLAGVQDELRTLLLNDLEHPIGNPVPADLYRHPMELYDRAPIGETAIGFATRQFPTVRFWDNGVEGKSWVPIEFLANLGPAGTGVPVSNTFDRAEFEREMGGPRKFRLAVGNERTITLYLPYNYRLEFKFRGLFTNVSDAASYSDLPQSFRDYAWSVAQRVRARTDASLQPTQTAPAPAPKTIPPLRP